MENKIIKPNNLSIIDGIMNSQEIGIRSYFNFVHKANRQKRIAYPNIHGYYVEPNEPNWMNRRSFRVTTSISDDGNLRIPDDRKVWDNVDDLFIIKNNRVRVCSIAYIQAIVGTLLSTVYVCIDSVIKYDFTIDNINHQVTDNLTGIMKPFNPKVFKSWHKYTLTYLPHPKLIYGCVIDRIKRNPVSFLGAKEAAEYFNVTISQVYKQLKKKNAHKVAEGAIAGNRIYVSFIKQSDFEELKKVKQHNLWYAERLQIVEEMQLAA